GTNRDSAPSRRGPLRKLRRRQPRTAPPTVPADRFIPRLLELEHRDCPSLTVGPNQNIGQALDNQNNPAVTFDASPGSQRVVSVDMEWDGGADYPDVFAPTYGFRVRTSPDGGN